MRALSCCLDLRTLANSPGRLVSRVIRCSMSCTCTSKKEGVHVRCKLRPEGDGRIAQQQSGGF